MAEGENGEGERKIREGMLPRFLSHHLLIFHSNPRQYESFLFLYH